MAAKLAIIRFVCERIATHARIIRAKNVSDAGRYQRKGQIDPYILSEFVSLLSRLMADSSGCSPVFPAALPPTSMGAEHCDGRVRL